jgi:hypothetical protein
MKSTLCQLRNTVTQAFILLLLLSGIVVAEPQARTDDNGVIRLLHIGKAWLLPDHPASLWIKDPRINWYPVPSHEWSMGEEAFRQLRLYLPRTERILHENFDVIIEDGMDASHLRGDFHRWMVSAIVEEGLGFLMADDSSSFATSGRHTSWYLYPIGDALPVSDNPEIFYFHLAYFIVPREEHADHPLLRNIPWNEFRIWAHNRPDPKPGSIVLAEMSGEHEWNQNKPVICYWDLEKGRSVAYVHKWAPGRIPEIAQPDFYRWRLAQDHLSHMVYFTARVEIPQDLELVHSLRQLFSDFQFQKGYLMATMDFADKFGANLKMIEAEMEDILQRKEAADRLYIVQELEESSAMMVGVLADIHGVTKEAIDAKDMALLWIFAIEWLVVSGTSVLAGFLVWTLMVRRALYREVRVTRLIEY